MTKERCEFEILCRKENGTHVIVFNVNDRDFKLTIAELKDKNVYETFNFILDEVKSKFKEGYKK